MKIKYSNAVYMVAITGAGGVVFTDGDLWHGECISMGFTTAELNRAEANPDKWIECTRETDLHTEAFDAMLEACKEITNLAEACALCVDDWTPERKALVLDHTTKAEAALALAKKVKGE